MVAWIFVVGGAGAGAVLVVGTGDDVGWAIVAGAAFVAAISTEDDDIEGVATDWTDGVANADDDALDNAADCAVTTAEESALWELQIDRNSIREPSQRTCQRGHSTTL